jgi:hypothetical protein
LSFRDAPLGAGAESVTTLVVWFSDVQRHIKARAEPDIRPLCALTRWPPGWQFEL